ncbi:Hypothetical_protein [Hexamita inflata]|uniref:Hypothetical_protein n=1 Tax=Hexamita inflata TaxID=28002 RepID=A0AA86ND82_9EUKA|nr:Hypothetical protein HINF_LOCUS4534 [Hexamita inflata]
MQFYAMNLNVSIISDPVSPKQRSINCTSSKLTFNLQASAFQEKSTRQNFLSRKWGTINEAHPELMNISQFCRNQLKKRYQSFIQKLRGQFSALQEKLWKMDQSLIEIVLRFENLFEFSRISEILEATNIIFYLNQIRCLQFSNQVIIAQQYIYSSQFQKFLPLTVQFKFNHNHHQRNRCNFQLALNKFVEILSDLVITIISRIILFGQD